MNPEQYIDAVAELARAGRPRPLKRVITARVRGDGRPVSVEVGGAEKMIVSPPLERDEPDGNAVLYTIYSILRDEDDPGGLENLRRAAAELLMASFNAGEGLAELQALSRLVGHLRVVDSEELRPLLLQQLYGFLESGLDRPFDRLVELEGDSLGRATLALDVWLAVMPIQPECRPHHQTRLKELFSGSLEALEGGYLLLEPRLRFLFLAFRALVKVKPDVAGTRGLWRLCKLIEKHAAELPRLRRRWLAACRHQGVVFASHPDWRRAFLAGVRRFEREPEFPAHGKLPLFRQSLEKLDGMWTEVAAAWRPRRPKAQRLSLELIAGGKS